MYLVLFRPSDNCFTADATEHPHSEKRCFKRHFKQTSQCVSDSLVEHDDRFSGVELIQIKVVLAWKFNIP